MLLSENNIFLIGKDVHEHLHCQMIEPLTGKILRNYRLNNHSSTISLFTLLPNGNLAISDLINNIYIYNFDGDYKHDMKVIRIHQMKNHSSLAISDNGHLLIGDMHGGIQEYNYYTRKRLQAFRSSLLSDKVETSIALELLFKACINFYLESKNEVKVHHQYRI